MKHTKYTAIASLVFTAIPFISALINNYIQLPMVRETSFRMTMTILFAISWFVLAYIVAELPDDLLQKFKLIKDASSKIRGYWYVEYKENLNIVSSILEICDDCGNTTASKLRDFAKDLTELSTQGIQSLQFNGNDQLTHSYAKGDSHYSFIRFEYKHQGEFDIIRIDDNGTDIPNKMYGTCCEINCDTLFEAGICRDRKIAKKMLENFALTPQLIERLLVYIYSNRHSNYAQEVIEAHNKRKMSETATVDLADKSDISDEKKKPSKK